MEPARTVSGVQPEAEAWRRYFGKLVKGWIGQEQGWLHAAVSDEHADLFVLPTGYGKTLAAMGVYVIKRARGVANRLLYAVPTDAQRDQLVPVKPGKRSVSQEAAAFFGVPLGEAVIADRISRTLRYHQEGKAEVFVVSYQQLLADKKSLHDFYRELLEYPGPDGRPCRWMIVRDEAHHQGLEGKWGEAVERLPFAYCLHLSATPLRTDGQRLVGVPVKPHPDIDGALTYLAAVEVSRSMGIHEGALRPPRAHIHHYFVDVVTKEGEQLRLTTEMLREEGVTDFSAYEVRRGLRYEGAYLSTMLADALECLNSKLIRQPGEHQLLGFAMTCGHAASVADHLNALEEGCADWIGVTRTDKENKAVLDRFEENGLKCLVQVEKAGEGFNNPRCSVLVFLDLTRSPLRIEQHIGRGLRRNWQLDRAVDICDGFASADTMTAALLLDLDRETAVYRDAEEEERAAADARDPQIYLPDLEVLDAEWYRTDRTGPGGQPTIYPEWMHRAAEGTGCAVDVVALIASYQPGASPPGHDRVAEAGERSELERWRRRVKEAVGKIAWAATRRLSPPGVFDKAMNGRFCVRINTQWKRENRGQDAMDAADTRKKYEWCQAVAAEINAHRFPSWFLTREEIAGWQRRDEGAGGNGSWPRQRSLTLR